VLIELNLMESPWAYSVMAVTILIDAYLLYTFFTVPRAGTPGDRSGPDDRISLDMSELPRDRSVPLASHHPCNGISRTHAVRDRRNKVSIFAARLSFP